MSLRLIEAVGTTRHPIPAHPSARAPIRRESRRTPTCPAASTRASAALACARARPSACLCLLARCQPFSRVPTQSRIRSATRPAISDRPPPPPSPPSLASTVRAAPRDFLTPATFPVSRGSVLVAVRAARASRRWIKIWEPAHTSSHGNKRPTSDRQTLPTRSDSKSTQLLPPPPHSLVVLAALLGTYFYPGCCPCSCPYLLHAGRKPRLPAVYFSAPERALSVCFWPWSNPVLSASPPPRILPGPPLTDGLHHYTTSLAPRYLDLAMRL